MKAPANNATGFQDGYRIGIDTCHRQRHNEFEGVQDYSRRILRGSRLTLTCLPARRLREGRDSRRLIKLFWSEV